jgi:hypothetical protein
MIEERPVSTTLQSFQLCLSAVTMATVYNFLYHRAVIDLVALRMQIGECATGESNHCSLIDFVLQVNAEPRNRTPVSNVGGYTTPVALAGKQMVDEYGIFPTTQHLFLNFLQNATYGQ